LFLFACIAVPLIGNGLRIVGIILLAHFTNNKYGVGVDHIVYGWGFNVAILLVLFLLGSFFRDPAEVAVLKSRDVDKADTSQMVIAALVVSSFLVSIGPAVAFWLDNRAPISPVVDLRRPLILRGWHLTDAPSNWRPNYPDTDASVIESLQPDRLARERPVDLYVGYYAQARTGHALTAHLNYLWNPLVWTQVGSGTVDARIDGREVRMQEWIVSSVFERRMIWACYWVDGAFTSKPLMVKLLQARAILAGHEGQALVAVSTVVDSTDLESRHRLSNALTALSDLPERLDAANHRGGTAKASN
jgi:EpsI family protein